MDGHLWNTGWKFMHGDLIEGKDLEYDDSLWYDVNLPHSFGIPYFMENEFYVGYGCYRKCFICQKEWMGKRIAIEFGAVFQRAEIYINGQLAGGHRGGYTPFLIDITEYISEGDNTIFVRVDNLWEPDLVPRAGEHVFQGGIYRDVTLWVMDPLHIAWYGTSVLTSEVSKESARLELRTEIEYQPEMNNELLHECELHSIINYQGKQIAELVNKYILSEERISEEVQVMELEHPHLWSPEVPNLYTMESILMVNGIVRDRCQTTFGIRSFSFSATEGFFLNGEPYEILGANVHQDHAGWADAVTRSGIRRDIRMIKECGMNFIRGSHYPHHTYFAEECDRQGILFWSENCFWGTGGPKEEGYWTASAYPIREEDEKRFRDSCKETLREMIRANRNHPSIVTWSMCNEPFFTDAQTIEKAKTLILELVELSHELDSSRPAAIGGAQRGGLDVLGDLAGYNGDGASIFLNPGFPNFVSEYGSIVEDRPGEATSRYMDGVETKYPWRSGKALWCGFHHGSILGDMGHMGMIDYYRLPLDTWYWYREKYMGKPIPQHAKCGVVDKIVLQADRTEMICDGTEDIQLIVSLRNLQGERVRGTGEIVLRVEEGGCCFPTGWEYVMSEEKGNFEDGMGAIELHACFPGKSVITAVTEAGLSAELELTVLQEAIGETGKVPMTDMRKKWKMLLPPPYLTPAPERETLSEIGKYRPVFCSSEETGYEARNITDGCINTFWHAKMSRECHGEWVALDLEGTKEIRKIIIIFEEMTYEEFEISISNDRKDYTAVYCSEKRPALTDLTIDLKNVRGRYIRLLFPKVAKGVCKMEILV